MCSFVTCYTVKGGHWKWLTSKLLHTLWLIKRHQTSILVSSTTACKNTSSLYIVHLTQLTAWQLVKTKFLKRFLSSKLCFQHCNPTWLQKYMLTLTQVKMGNLDNRTTLCFVVATHCTLICNIFVNKYWKEYMCALCFCKHLLYCITMNGNKSTYKGYS